MSTRRGFIADEACIFSSGGNNDVVSSDAK
jgi:hypothetical protein